MMDYPNNRMTVVPITEMEAANKHLLTEIKFEAFATMYNYGQRVTTMGFKEIAGPSQWFKCHVQITLESIRELDEYNLGKILKEMLKELDNHIEQYEKREK